MATISKEGHNETMKVELPGGVSIEMAINMEPNREPKFGSDEDPLKRLEVNEEDMGKYKIGNS